MRKLRPLVPVFTLLTGALLGACEERPTEPSVSAPAPASPRLGVVEITIRGIGAEEMSASAAPYTSSGFPLGHTVSGVDSDDGTGDGTIQLEPVSTGSFTRGERGAGGQRYLYATFDVRNAQVDGTAYDTPRENLTFLAVDTDGTHGQTAVSRLVTFGGTDITGPDAVTIAEGMIPTGAAYQQSVGELLSMEPDVLQALTEGEADGVDLTGTSANDLFPYGFVVRNRNDPGDRTLAANPDPDDFEGVVTFAFRVPLQATAADDPFQISMQFLAVDDDEVRLTQSVEEQNPSGRQDFEARAAALGAEYVTLLPGSRFGGATFRQFCDPVRVAGSEGSATASLFPDPPEFASLSPDPYAGDGSGSRITATTDFAATFDAPVESPDAGAFVVRGSQSGLRFSGEAYSGDGTTTVTSPSGTFFPGELVEVSLTSGLGTCPGVVARYRVGVGTGGSDDFAEVGGSPFAVADAPRAIGLGDVNGDGNLDAVIPNDFPDHDIAVLLGDGTGSFAAAAGSPFAVGNAPRAIGLGDVNGDGDLDALTANFTGQTVTVMLGDGTGGFAEAPSSPHGVGGGTQSIAIGDVNGDGHLDAVAGISSQNSVRILLGDGSGDFSEAPTSPHGVGTFPFALALADVDGDGDLDAVTGNLSANSVTVLLGDGAGAFEEAPGSPYAADVQSVVFADMNGDGDSDIVTAGSVPPADFSGHPEGWIAVFLGDGSGGFGHAPGSPFSSGRSLKDLAVGDLNQDGNLDVLVSDADLDEARVLFGDGTGAFGGGRTFGVENQSTMAVAVGDANGDLSLDLFVANFSSGDLSVLLGDQ